MWCLGGPCVWVCRFGNVTFLTFWCAKWNILYVSLSQHSSSAPQVRQAYKTRRENTVQNAHPTQQPDTVEINHSAKCLEDPTKHHAHKHVFRVSKATFGTKVESISQTHVQIWEARLLVDTKRASSIYLSFPSSSKECLCEWTQPLTCLSVHSGRPHLWGVALSIRVCTPVSTFTAPPYHVGTLTSSVGFDVSPFSNEWFESVSARECQAECYEYTLNISKLMKCRHLQAPWYSSVFIQTSMIESAWPWRKQKVDASTHKTNTGTAKGAALPSIVNLMNGRSLAVLRKQLVDRWYILSACCSSEQ